MVRDMRVAGARCRGETAGVHWAKKPPNINGVTAMNRPFVLRAAVAMLALTFASPTLAQRPSRPNILVIFGDDVGYWNISKYNRGMMGYRTPQIDRIATEGAVFTDAYGQQICTAGRAAFITGQFGKNHLGDRNEFLPTVQVNDIISHEDWLPTLLAAAGQPNMKEALLKGATIGGATYMVHMDGHDLMPARKGEAKEWPRKEFLK